MREKGYCMDKSQREDNIFGDGCVGSNCMDMTVFRTHHIKKSKAQVFP
jgi:hypothetical protein